MKKAALVLLFFTLMSLLAYQLTAQVFAPANGEVKGENTPLTLGLRFTPKQNILVTGVRFYRDFQGDVSVTLWRNGTLLSTRVSSDWLTGWKDVFFIEPVPVAAGQEYIVSYFSSFGGYMSAERSFPVSAPLYTALSGRYTYAPTEAFPASQYGNSQYFVEPIVDTLPAQKPPVDSCVTIIDTVYIVKDSCSIDYSLLNDLSFTIMLPEVGGVAQLPDSTTIYKAIFGVAQPHVRLKDDTSIRQYRFTRYYTINGIKTAVRFTLYKTGAWIRERQINGVWTIWDY